MKTFENNCIVRLATPDDINYLEDVAYQMALSANQRGVAIAQRTTAYFLHKIKQNQAFIAVSSNSDEWIGFCYLEVWKNKKYIANSGLIVSANYRSKGLARQIKEFIFDYTVKQYPAATLFSLTANPAVKQVNLDLGYQQISFQQLLSDNNFMEGKDTWVDYVALMKDEVLSKKYAALIYQQAKGELLSVAEKEIQLLSLAV